MDIRGARLPQGDWQALVALLAAEEEHYRRLLRLAWRQNSYMKRQDVDRLQANAADWSRHLPEADRARIARERCCADLQARAGVPAGARLEPLLDACGADERRRVVQALDRLRRTVGRLARQNELNRHLAAFCLDLAVEESRIFRDSVLDDPAGCYGRDARNTNLGAGGVLVKQA
ncbi:MAG: flagellar export chaperone FlgN [Krumholzibacteria bacterium]|nr:flagellar export chaperone FlgN [Candidatus Krumholzibacteria bacterium]